MNICIYIKCMHDMGYKAVKTIIKQCKVSKSYFPYKITQNQYIERYIFLFAYIGMIWLNS